MGGFCVSLGNVFGWVKKADWIKLVLWGAKVRVNGKNPGLRKDQLKILLKNQVNPVIPILHPP
jgi:hypothetical protein